MTWQLRIARRVQKQLVRLPANDQRRLLAAVDAMCVNPFADDLVRLRSERAAWRRRVGAYRIFFDVRTDERVVDVVEISRRTSTTY